jgi:hypothetical protein
MRIWRVWGVDSLVGEVVAGDEQEAREAWRSYLNGFRVTEPGGPVPSPHVRWIREDWEAGLKHADAYSPAMQSWRGYEFGDVGVWTE